jgi:hypothetical protein
MNKLKIALEKATKGETIPDSLIPEEWKKSFDKFMFGQTCLINEENGQFETYPQDFLIWYWKNEKEINRNVKIDDIGF